MKEAYMKRTFRGATLALIRTINGIIESYRNQGYILTVRQLYYQLVAADIIPNDEKSYKNIVNTVNDGRNCGLIDWDMIEDRTRSFTEISAWESGSEILKSSAKYFHMDRWKDQGARVFCIIEKEALVSVLERSCKEYDIPLLAARGYPSSSVLREFAKFKLMKHGKNEERIVILHLGDHDPSGMDMSRDLEQRLSLFSRETEFEFKRIALNYEQIEELNPPPNPAKNTDSRFEAYREEFGPQSWELDALSPAYLNNLVKLEVQKIIDPDIWKRTEDEIESVKSKLLTIAENFDD